MASPTLVSITTTADNALLDELYIDVDMPAFDSGDLGLNLLTRDDTSGPNWDAPTGWTELFDAGTDVAHAAFYRQCDGTEDAVIRWEPTDGLLASSCAAVFRTTGHADPSTQAPEVATTNVCSDSSSFDPPSVSVTGGSKDILTITGCGINTYSTSISGFPSGYSNTADLQSHNTGSEVRQGYGTKASTASSENPGAFTLSSGRTGGASTIVIHPAAGGGGGSPKFNDISTYTSINGVSTFTSVNGVT